MQLLGLLIKVLIFIVGACIGSFLNVCIVRLPKDESIIIPRSSCPQCKTPIKWFDNIPLISFFALHKKCRACKKPISWRYPVVECITGLIFLMLYLKLDLSMDFAKVVFLFCMLIVVSFIDIEYHAIPAYLCVLGIMVGLALNIPKTVFYLKAGLFDFHTLPIVKSVKTLVFVLGFTYLFKLFGDVFISVYLRLRKKDNIEGEKESLGLGDVDFMGMVAVFLGIKQAILIFFIAPFIAAVYSIFAIFFKKSHLIPYLPYLSLATLLSFFWNRQILHFALSGLGF
jgi:leader peptidase (prepilin peptidase) / N-methyltransferase